MNPFKRAAHMLLLPIRSTTQTIRQVASFPARAWADYQLQRAMQHAADAWYEIDDVARIEDGVNYALPISLPRSVVHTLQQEGKLDEFLAGAQQRLNESTFRQATAMQFDSPTSGSKFRPPTDDPLAEWDMATRRYVLENTHSAAQRNPLAKQALKYASNFVIGEEGFRLRCDNDELRKVLQAFIDHEDNQIRKYERQVIKDLMQDGELFIRYFTEKGEVVAAPLRPWECEGIKTELGFFRRKESYEFQFQKTTGDTPFADYKTVPESIPAKEVQHLAVNNSAYELRGRPDLFVVLPWLKAHKDWLENRARLNHWRTALIFHVKLAGASPAQVAAWQQRLKKPPTPGSMLVSTDALELNAITADIKAMDAAEDGRQIKLMVAVGLSLPEYFLGDGHNVNLASATKQELPALTSFGEYQYILIHELWTPMFKRVIQIAIDNEKLPKQVVKQDQDGDPILDENDQEQMVDTLEAFSVSYEPISSSDPKTIAEALTLHRAAGAISMQSYRDEAGLDHHKEEKNLRREREQENEDVAQGRSNPVPGQDRPEALASDIEDDDAGEDDDTSEEPIAARVARILQP